MARGLLLPVVWAGSKSLRFAVPGFALPPFWGRFLALEGHFSGPAASPRLLPARLPRPPERRQFQPPDSPLTPRIKTSMPKSTAPTPTTTRATPGTRQTLRVRRP
jgi:hypothetical protein